MILVIYGGRDYTDREELFRECDRCRSVSLVLCGEAKGADTLGKEWALSRGIEVRSFPADWDKHGKKAGHLRNIEMAEIANIGLGFWDGKSKGTKHMNSQMKKFKVPHRIIQYTANVFAEFESDVDANGTLEDLFS